MFTNEEKMIIRELIEIEIEELNELIATALDADIESLIEHRTKIEGLLSKLL